MARLKPCPACGNQVSTQAPACPKCGHALARKRGCGCGSLVGLVLVAIVVAAIFGPESPRPPIEHQPAAAPASGPAATDSPPLPAKAANETPMAGDEATIEVSGAKRVFLAKEEAWDALLDAENRSDTEEVALLAARGKVAIERNGVRVKVLKASFASMLVRVRDGVNPGFEGWIQREFVKKVE